MNTPTSGSHSRHQASPTTTPRRPRPRRRAPAIAGRARAASRGHSDDEPGGELHEFQRRDAHVGEAPALGRWPGEVRLLSWPTCSPPVPPILARHVPAPPTSGSGAPGFATLRAWTRPEPTCTCSTWSPPIWRRASTSTGAWGSRCPTSATTRCTSSCPSRRVQPRDRLARLGPDLARRVPGRPGGRGRGARVPPAVERRRRRALRRADRGRVHGAPAPVRRVLGRPLRHRGRPRRQRRRADGPDRGRPPLHAARSSPPTREARVPLGRG